MRRIVFVGNCQAFALMDAFNLHISPYTGERAFHVAAYHDLDDASRTILTSADVIVDLIFDFAQRTNIADLGLDKPVIPVPYVNGNFLWPYAYEAHPRNAPVGFIVSGPYPVELGDAYLNRLMRDGVPATEAASRYLDLDINQKVRLDRRFEMNLALQRQRDEKTGFAVAELMERHFHEEPIFLTPDHPNRRIFLHVVQRCFTQLGVAEHLVARLPRLIRRSFFPQDALPVHPRLAAHFGLTWANETTRYPFWLDGDFTFAEFIARYLRYDYCEDFAIGHYLAAQHGQRVEAIARLRAGLTAYPKAHRAWALLSHMLVAEGALAEALEAAGQAVSLNPGDAEAFAHLGNLLTNAGESAAAKSAYERAVALEPEHTPWLRLLAGHWERQGKRAEAGALAALLAQKDPLDYELHVQRGHLLAGSGDAAGAISAFSHALGLAPHIRGVHAARSHVLTAQGRIMEAIADAKAALEEAPEDRDLRVHLGNLLVTSGEAVAAQGQEVVSRFPDDKDSIMGKNAVRSTIIQKLHRGQDPFVGFPGERYALDIQGWGSEHPYLVEAMDAVQPRVVVEIGVWKGGSTLTMARRLKELRLDAVVIAVDTWLGSWDHWENDEWFGHLRLEKGYPTLARAFMANVVKSGLQDYVVPLPLDSLNAAHVIRSFDIIPDVVHIDGGHDYEAVSADLRVWWDLLKPGGLLIGDDYSDYSWPDVKRAFDDFFGARDLMPFEFEDNKCRIRKPLDQKYYLMTAHQTFIGVDSFENLIQLNSVHSNAGTAIYIIKSGGKFTVTDGVLKSFTLEKYPDGISFKKNNKYLCALENSTSFAVDRDNRNIWEIFRPTDERGIIGHLHDLLLSLPVANDRISGDERILSVLRHRLERRPLQNTIILSEEAKAAARAASLLEAAGLNGWSIQVCGELPRSETERGDRPSSITAEQPEAGSGFSAPELIVATDASVFPKLIHGLSRRNAMRASMPPEIMILTDETDFCYSIALTNLDGYHQVIHPMTAIIWPNLVYLSKRSSLGAHAHDGTIVASVRKDEVVFLTEGYSLANSRTAPTIRIFRPILEECGRSGEAERCALLIQFDDDAPRDLVSVGYGRRRGLLNVRLVPDPYFLESQGFATLRKAALEGRLPPWDRRQDTVFWRGSASTNFRAGNGEPVERLERVPRIAMCLALKNRSRVDAAIMASWELDKHFTTPESESVTDWLEKQKIFRPGEPMINHANYRFLIDIDGVANAWGFFEKLLLGACVLKVSSPFEQWFYEEIAEWQHFVPVQHDLSDLIEKIEWCWQHEDEAREIAERGQRFALQHTYEAALEVVRDAVKRSLISSGSVEPPCALSAIGQGEHAEASAAYQRAVRNV